MLKIIREQWNRNESILKRELEKLNENNIKGIDYKFLCEKIVTCILNEGEPDEELYEWSTKNIAEIDNGDYQGTLLFIIPKTTYQPGADHYLMTYVGYGSCSGCDTLTAIMSNVYYGDGIERARKELLQLCRDMIVRMIKPYNSGWMNNPKYDEYEEEKTGGGMSVLRF